VNKARAGDSGSGYTYIYICIFVRASVLVCVGASVRARARVCVCVWKSGSCAHARTQLAAATGRASVANLHACPHARVGACAIDRPGPYYARREKSEDDKSPARTPIRA
jgi:hypothetical protein